MELIRSSTEGPARWYPPSRRSRTLRKQAESLQTDVDDSRVGARREDGCPPTAYTSRKEAFIVDLRVWSGQSLAPGAQHDIRAAIEIKVCDRTGAIFGAETKGRLTATLWLLIKRLHVSLL